MSRPPQATEAGEAYAKAASILVNLTSPSLAGAPTWHSPDPLEWVREEEGEVDDEEDAGLDEDEDEDMGLYGEDVGEEDEEVVEDPLLVLHRPRSRPGRDLLLRGAKRVGGAAAAVSALPPTPRPTATPRARTPVTSNESDRKDRRRTAAAGLERSRFPVAALKPTSDAAYRVYHDALRAHRRRHDELRRERATRGGAEDEDDDDDYYLANNMVQDGPAMVAADVQFLSSLREACWAAASPSSSPASPLPSLHEESFTRTQKEGNLWLLLAELRKLDADAILWEVTRDVKLRMERFYHFLSQLPVEETPRSVLGRMNDTSDKSLAPLMLRRRKTVLAWLEAIFARIVPERSQWPTKGSLLISPRGLPTTTKDKELFSVSLALLLSGRFDEAKQLARDLGTPWRAAAWSGDEPHGYESDGDEEVAVGNDQRPLWRRMMWLQSEHLNGASGVAGSGKNCACPEEGALAALMGCHLDNARSNPALRTWEKGLYASLRCLWGRAEDEVLYLHNQARSIRGEALFTTTQFTKYEEDHLNLTKRYGNLDEAGILNELQTSDYVQLGSRDVVTDAAASVLAGQESLFLYLAGCMNSVDRFAAEQKEAVRFLTHFVIYLDSLCPVSSTVPEESQEQLGEWKNALVRTYLGLLAERETLSGLYVLYSSFLPRNAVLEVLPPLLCEVDNSRERAEIVNQLLQYMPDLDLEVLMQVVDAELRLVEPAALAVGAGDDADDDALPPLNDVPTRMDMRKIKSIEWLCFQPNHRATALGFANMLLRSFFLRDKLGCAAMFVRDYLPPDIADPADASNEESGTLSDVVAAEVNRGTMVDLRSEHAAYTSYLEAIAALQDFADKLLVADSKPRLLDDEFDASKLGPAEADIARAAERRQLIQDKRKASSVVVKAARASTSSLLAVLRHPGGWLVTETEDSTLSQLRRKVLPQAVTLYLRACEQVAEWLAASLDDATTRLECPDAASALRALDDAGEDGERSPLDPAYWTGLALAVPVVVTDSEYAVDSALSDSQVHEFLRKLAEIEIQHLKYVCHEAQS